MKRTLALLFALVLWLCEGMGFSLKTGDLLFQTEGNSGFSEAIASATGSPDSINYIHVGIATVGADSLVSVIEASPGQGVVVTPLADFLSSSPKVCGQPGVTVKRLSFDFPAEETIAKALSHIGEEYDWWYLPDNGRMYCSELVYESFLDKDGNHIFTSSPMNFRAPDGSMPEFWRELFGRLGMEVPEGVEGTNPNDISKDPLLIEVGRYF